MAAHGHQPIEFETCIDPDGVLKEHGAKHGLVHIEDNMVAYFERRPSQTAQYAILFYFIFWNDAQDYAGILTVQVNPETSKQANWSKSRHAFLLRG